MANIELDGANKKIKVDSGDLTLDIPGDIILDADGGDVVFADCGTNLLKVTNSSSDVVFQPQVDTKDIVFKQYDGTVVATVEDNATFNVPTGKLAINGTAITSTAAEINLIDGGTARGTTAIADGDGVLINDAGTMRQTTVETLKTYIGSGLSNADYWNKGADQSISADTGTLITGTWAQQQGRGGGGNELGSGLSESSGIFTFPATGIWYVSGWFRIVRNGNTRYVNLSLEATTDDSSYSVLGFGSGQMSDHSNDGVSQVDASALIDCSDTTSVKFKFTITADEAISVGGDGNYTQSGLVAIRLGDT